VRTGEPSRTALAAAFYRAQHHLHDEPKLLDDPVAHRLLTAGEMAALVDRRVQDGRALGFAGDADTVLARTLRAATPASSVLVRARYAEDRLAAAIDRGLDQYVVVGAGLDTFAVRRPDLQDRVRVFELDHPESQALKRTRLAAAGLLEPPNLHFGAVDFERESAADVLARLPFRAERPAFFAWLGVTMYLTRPAIDATWRALRTVAARESELVFDFLHPDAFAPDAPAGVRRLLDRTRALGEPITTSLDPARLAADLRAAGWTLVEDLDAAEIDRRYFASCTDGYRARAFGHLASAAAG
jgi:methyltransferase (TIGR00027 family)